MNPEKLYRASKDQKVKVLVYKEMYLYNLESYKPKDSKPLPLKNIVFKLQKLIITFSKVFTEDFFQFLGPSTKELFCTDLKLTTDVKFGELVPRIPNVKSIYLRKSNIEFDNSWPEILSKINPSKLEELDFCFENINFDAEVLVHFMKVSLLQAKRNFIPVENERKHKSSLLKISFYGFYYIFEPK